MGVDSGWTPLVTAEREHWGLPVRALWAGEAFMAIEPPLGITEREYAERLAFLYRWANFCTYEGHTAIVCSRSPLLPDRVGNQAVLRYAFGDMGWYHRGGFGVDRPRTGWAQPIYAPGWRKIPDTHRLVTRADMSFGRTMTAVLVRVARSLSPAPATAVLARLSRTEVSDYADYAYGDYLNRYGRTYPQYTT